MKSLLYSQYVIDGVAMDMTPAALLGIRDTAVADAEPVADETTDPAPGAPSFLISDFEKCLDILSRTARRFPVTYAADYTKFRMAVSLIDHIWRRGHFGIGDLALSAEWRWNDREVGNMAAFYSSAASFAEYADALGLGIDGCRAVEADTLDFSVSAHPAAFLRDEDVFASQPYRTGNPEILDGCIPCVAESDPQSWIVYIPFETADYRYGGSLLSQATGRAGGAAPRIGDADYFLDCYEVLRELIEDGVVISGVSVGDGGLACALKKLCSGGISAELSDMTRAFSDSDPMKLLFSEIPGALVQIRDIDYDYLDAELLLQDVVFFPLGHPDASGKVSVSASAKTGLQRILESLVQKQSAEGED